jgi:Rne/Rng family ribonuclease
MSKKIIINVADHETRVALVEDETIVELFIERKGSRDNTGNINKGRVQRVLPGMQAAFVDIGLNQAAFIYVDDVVRDNYADIEDHFICNDFEEDAILEEGPHQRHHFQKKKSITSKTLSPKDRKFSFRFQNHPLAPRVPGSPLIFHFLDDFWC